MSEIWSLSLCCRDLTLPESAQKILESVAWLNEWLCAGSVGHCGRRSGRELVAMNLIGQADGAELARVAVPVSSSAASITPPKADPKEMIERK